jgi:glycosyltransferase involved in cell wall biosynthesis
MNRTMSFESQNQNKPYSRDCRAGEDMNPPVSVVICTCNRGDSVVATLETVLANTHPNFEVILVDQSDDQDTANAIKRFQSDRRLIYIYSDTKGVGRSKNIGISHARGEIVVFTDDDCTVPTTWLEIVAELFAQYPRVGVIFSNVVPAQYDDARGFIPAYMRKDSKLIRSFWDKCHARGMGAGISLRREMAFEIGGFDDFLGAGGDFRSCEDGDIAVRALINGWWVYETHEVAVVHHGFRTWLEGKSLTQRDWYGIGAAYSKPLKCGRWGISIVIFYEAVVKGVLEPLSNILYLKKPQGLKRFWYFWCGFMQGLRTPVDRQHMVFKKDDQIPGERSYQDTSAIVGGKS